MRCLYCGKGLALFKRLRGGEFCSDAHRQRYQAEYTQLALNRLLANSPKESEEDSGEDTPKEVRPAEPESPALKRRERVGREEPPARLTPTRATPAPASIAAPLDTAAYAEVARKQMAVLDPEPEALRVAEQAPALSSGPAAPEMQPPPAGMSSFLVEFPVPILVDPAAPADAAEDLALLPTLLLPRCRELQGDAEAGQLDPAARMELSLFAVADYQTPPHERGLEAREFVHGVPHVETNVKPAVESGFEPVWEPVETKFDAQAPDGSPGPWLASKAEFPSLRGEPEILLGELARLDFAPTEWGQEARGQEAGGTDETPPGIASARLEPMRVEPVQSEPALHASSRPEPLHFEPVHIDPVFMEKIAGTAAAHVRETEPAAARPEILVEEAAEAAVPPPITRPMPMTLHGLAPARGKALQVFTSAAARISDVQVPRETGLPLRPIMVLAPAPKPASVPQTVPAGGAAAKSIPIPGRRDPRPEAKLRRPEVRVLPIQLKERVKPESVKPPSIHTELGKTEPGKPEPGTLEPTKPEPAAAPKSAKPSVEPRAAEIPAAAPTPAETKPKVAPIDELARNGRRREAVAETKGAARRALPAEPEPDLLGLPKLSFQDKGGVWSRLPMAARFGAIAAILALVAGGVILTSRGAGAPKNAAPSDEPVVVEEPALANTAGWMQDWFVDRIGSKPGRHVDVLRASLTLRDYRLRFEGQIEQGALGWVFRANDKSFYVEKIQDVTPGPQPKVALVHFAVINGAEQARTQIPLPLQARLDTTYRIRMDVIGDRFTTWVQDQKVDQWTDSRIDAGGVGLYYDSGDSASLTDTMTVIPLRRK